MEGVVTISPVRDPFDDWACYGCGIAARVYADHVEYLVQPDEESADALIRETGCLPPREP